MTGGSWLPSLPGKYPSLPSFVDRSRDPGTETNVIYPSFGTMDKSRNQDLGSQTRNSTGNCYQEPGTEVHRYTTLGTSK